MRVRYIILASLVLASWPGRWCAGQEQPPAAVERHAEPAAATHEVAGEGHEAHKPALLTFDPGVALWTIIVFLALLIILRAVAWKPLLKALQQREAFIQNSIDAAKQQNEEAERLLKTYQAQLEKARVEATAIVDEGRRDADAVRRRLHDEARQEAEALVARARRDIGQATDAALKELYDHTAELSVRLAGEIVAKELSPDDHRRLVADSLARMKAVEREKLN